MGESDPFRRGKRRGRLVQLVNSPAIACEALRGKRGNVTGAIGEARGGQGAGASGGDI